VVHNIIIGEALIHETKEILAKVAEVEAEEVEDR
jgi:hypothetical protein